MNSTDRLHGVRDRFRLAAHTVRTSGQGSTQEPNVVGDGVHEHPIALGPKCFGVVLGIGVVAQIQIEQDDISDARISDGKKFVHGGGAGHHRDPIPRRGNGGGHAEANRLMVVNDGHPNHR